MVRDRRFVDVSDFKSVLTSAQRSGQRAGLGYVHPKRILVVYHDATARGRSPRLIRPELRQTAGGNQAWPEVRVQLSKPMSRRKRRKFRWDFNDIRLDGNVEAGSPEGFVRS